MNLTCNPWIPITRIDGGFDLVSLLSVFEESSPIRRLSARPHEKIALMRLLLAIAQAAMDGPSDHESWEICLEKLPAAGRDYLKKWEASFELFGDGLRFLQVRDLKKVPNPKKSKSEIEKDGERGTSESIGTDQDEDFNPASKLDLGLANGNNATLFDNHAGARALSDDRLALSLLTFQCFSPGGLIGVAKWHGKDSPGNGSSNHAPCTPSGMLHTYIEGESLLKTLRYNLLSRDECSATWGRPIWELPVDSPSDRGAVENATKTYLGRLVPLSRAIRLNPGGRQMTLANGVEYPLYPAYREAAATYVMRQDESVVLGVSLGRSLWRQLSAITVKRRADTEKVAGPLALSNLSGHENVTLWIGALATDKGKIEDSIEGAYDLPAEMFRESGRKLFEEGVQLAETWQRALSFSVKIWATAMKLSPVPYDGARRYFWTAIEQGVPILLDLARQSETAGNLAQSAWGLLVKAAAIEAYTFACAHQTPRQIEAFARGRQQLRPPAPGDGKPAKKPAKPQKETVV